MVYGICSNCGDTYPLPEGMIEGAEYTCSRCGKIYNLRIVRMDEFVFNRLISTKGE